MALQEHLKLVFAALAPLIYASPVAEMDRLRVQIRKLDRELIALVAKRLRLCVEVGRQKQALGLMIRNHQVEAKVYANARATAIQSGLDPDHAEALMRQVLDLAIAVQAADR